MTTVDVRVTKARREQADLLEHSEHCSLDSRLLDRLGICPGRQVRLVHPTAGPALYTVAEERHETEPGIVRMGCDGRARLEASDGFPAVLHLQVPDLGPDLGPAGAPAGLVERLDESGAATGLAVLAPHGGGIEPGTDAQAELVGRRLGSDRATVWECRGWWPSGLSFERWHITSTDIDPRSFPRLRLIHDRGFAHAVAFHGATLPDQSAVLVGGLAPKAVRAALVAAVADVLARSTLEVRLAEDADGLNGDDPRNIVNRLTVEGRTGVQIEQNLTARQQYGPAIAEAVAAVYAGLLGRR